MSQWVEIGLLRVEGGRVVILALEDVTRVPAGDVLDAMGPVGVGVDLGPTVGISGVLIPTGMGDG